MRRLAAAALAFLLAQAALAGPIILSGARGSVTAPPSSDWYATEAARGGVVFASKLETQTDLDDWKLANGNVGRLSISSSVKMSWAAASFAFETLNSNSTNDAQVSLPFGRTFGNGDTLWVAVWVREPPEGAYANWPGGGDGEKLYIISRDGNGSPPTGSNQVNEVVSQINNQGGHVSGYHQDHNGSFVVFDTSASTNCTGSDFRRQPAIDNGASPLSGNNPDTGSAWSSCIQDAARYGPLYGRAATPGSAETKDGLGDPFSGGYRFTPDAWHLVTTRIVIGTFGSANHRVTMWVAREGQNYVKVIDSTGVDLGGGPDYNALNLSMYATGRTSGGRHVSANTGELAGCFTVWNVSAGHATGDGTLAWNASTQRLSWQANGDSAGTARGYSTAAQNGFRDFLERSLISSTAANYINGEFTPAGCPGSNTTATVTIATDRPTVVRNYNGAIVSTSAILGPNGDTPP